MEAKALAEVQEGHTRVSREELLEKLKTNRNKHAEEYKVALKGWRVVYAEALGKKAAEIIEHGEKVREGATVTPFYTHALFDLPNRPEDHTDDYDTIIARMEMSKDEEIFIKHGDFAKFVLDKWKWKEAHTEAFTNYSVAAARS